MASKKMKTLTINGNKYEVSGELEPLVLYHENAGEYDSNTDMGDKALEAILNGRQILVRVPNSDGKTYTAIFSPVLMYQLPNNESDYLYLFYLKDEKQNIDLSALGVGTVQIPIYGELQMKLSTTYHECPLV